VKIAKRKRNFTLNTTNGHPVEVLSVSSEGQLLVGLQRDRQLHVYSADRRHLTSITLPDNDRVYDAVWTRRGNIVYSESGSGKVVTMSQSCDVIQKTNLSQPTWLSVSTDGVIYLISDCASVYQSTDNGVTWSHMFNVTDGWKCYQVIKASTDSNTDVLWTLVESAERVHLRVYTVDKRRSAGDNVSWCEVPGHVTVDLGSRMAYDGLTNIFVNAYSDRAVHVWSVSGQYDRQLMTRQQLNLYPCRVAVDTQRHMMYVGLEKGTVGVFELTYESVGAPTLPLRDYRSDNSAPTLPLRDYRPDNTAPTLPLRQYRSDKNTR
jgi:hypothetical protein